MNPLVVRRPHSSFGSVSAPHTPSVHYLTIYISYRKINCNEWQWMPSLEYQRYATSLSTTTTASPSTVEGHKDYCIASELQLNSILWSLDNYSIISGDLSLFVTQSLTSIRLSSTVDIIIDIIGSLLLTNTTDLVLTECRLLVINGFIGGSLKLELISSDYSIREPENQSKH